MLMLERGRTTGVFPRGSFGPVEAEGIQKPFDPIDVYSAVGATIMNRYNSRKTLSIITPDGMSESEALEYIRRSAYRIVESRKSVNIFVLPDLISPLC